MSTQSRNNQLKLLFSRKDIVSDWEDGPGDKGPTQILPIWQSEEFHQIVWCSEKMLVAFAKKSQYPKLQKLLDQQSDEKKQDVWDFVDIPRKLPEDCCGPFFWLSYLRLKGKALKRKNLWVWQSFYKQWGSSHSVQPGWFKYVCRIFYVAIPLSIILSWLTTKLFQNDIVLVFHWFVYKLYQNGELCK